VEINSPWHGELRADIGHISDPGTDESHKAPQSTFQSKRYCLGIYQSIIGVGTRSFDYGF
jgi:hypothetical protein